MPNGRRNGARRRRRAPRRGAPSAVMPMRMPIETSTIAPPYVDVKLVYSDLTSVSLITFGDRTFALNGLFDPNISGVGVQPTGFDQWMAIYNRYLVTAAVMTVEYFNLATGVLSELIIFPSASGTAIPSASAAVDLPYAKRNATSGTAGKPYTRVRLQMPDIASYLGRPLTESTLYGTIAANPGTVAYGHVVVSSVDGVTNLNGYYRVTIQYSVRFFSVVQLDQS